MVGASGRRRPRGQQSPRARACETRPSVVDLGGSGGDPEIGAPWPRFRKIAPRLPVPQPCRLADPPRTSSTPLREVAHLSSPSRKRSRPARASDRGAVPEVAEGCRRAGQDCPRRSATSRRHVRSDRRAAVRGRRYQAACQAAGTPDKWEDRFVHGHTAAKGWNQPYEGRYDMTFTLKAGHSASQAVKDFLAGPTIADYRVIGVAIEMEELRDELGDQKFDRLFGSKNAGAWSAAEGHAGCAIPFRAQRSPPSTRGAAEPGARGSRGRRAGRAEAAGGGRDRSAGSRDDRRRDGRGARAGARLARRKRGVAEAPDVTAHIERSGGRRA